MDEQKKQDSVEVLMKAHNKDTLAEMYLHEIELKQKAQKENRDLRKEVKELNELINELEETLKNNQNYVTQINNQMDKKDFLLHESSKKDNQILEEVQRTLQVIADAVVIGRKAIAHEVAKPLPRYRMYDTETEGEE